MTVAPHAKFGLLVVATFLGSSEMSTSDWIKGETVVIVKGDHPFLGSMLSIDMLELFIELSINRSMYALYKTCLSSYGLCQAISGGCCLCL